MLNRRNFGSVLAISSLLSTSVLSQTASSKVSLDDFELELRRAGSDLAAIEDARQFRELGFREAGPTDDMLAAAPNLPRRYKSAKAISGRAKALIIQFEVSGEARYRAAYQRPVWPKGDSGVTIGVGYDLGYTDRDRLKEDWSGLIPDAMISSLSPACRITGQAAGGLVALLQGTEVPWSAAMAQFDRFVPFVAGETIHAFPKSEGLSSDSFGALVSLVYNRGSAMNSRPDDSLDRRREMRVIKELVAAGTLDAVAAQIRSMARLWKNDPNARGLLDRRELEARLFEGGLA